MKSALFFLSLALLALSTLAFAQPKSVSWDYPGDWDCTVTPPLTYGLCFTGTPIPDGTVMNILVNGTVTFTWPLNGAFVCEPGYFSTNYFDIDAGRTVVLDLVYQGSHYVSRTYTIANDETFLMYQADWTCYPVGDPCSAVDATEAGAAGPYDISSGGTRSFIDTCTVRIAAVGGIAHGVSVQVFDAVPQYHPVAYNYMSRVVAIYWNGSVDPTTSLQVRMYYTNAELNESGFASAGCVIAARFDEFAANWSPVPASSGLKYIEFNTDHSGYYTFDCHATAPRAVSMGDPKISSGDGELVLRWKTMDEFESYRFHVLRADKPEGPFAEVAAVSSKLPNIMTVGSYDYEYRDSGLENGRTYFYRLSSEDLHGNSAEPGIAVSGAPSLNGGEVQISEYRLHPAYPNPFNPETRITYDVLEAGHVDLRVFDILGREVARLVDNDQPQGRYSSIFNARDLPSGLYFYRIDIGGKFTSTQKMLLLK